MTDDGRKRGDQNLLLRPLLANANLKRVSVLQNHRPIMNNL